MALLAGWVLQLARAVAPHQRFGGRDRLPHPVPSVLAVPAAAAALTDPDPAGACAYAASRRQHAAQLQAGTDETRQVIMADVVGACIDDLQRVIDLRPG